jgi:hypothetical protein
MLGDEIFDVVLFLGSMHHMPREYIRLEVQLYVRHMRVGSRLIQLAYPSTRWRCSGSETFPRFCSHTDHSCAWAEWYDLGKALRTFEPARFAVLYAGVVGVHEFAWWDLVYLGSSQ